MRKCLEKSTKTSESAQDKLKLEQAPNGQPGTTGTKILMIMDNNQQNKTIISDPILI